MSEHRRKALDRPVTGDSGRRRRKEGYTQSFQPFRDEERRIGFHIHVYDDSVEGGIRIKVRDPIRTIDSLEANVRSVEYSSRRVVQKEAVFQDEKTFTCKTFEHTSANVLYLDTSTPRVHMEASRRSIIRCNTLETACNVL
jgi:hypothetical protein